VTIRVVVADDQALVRAGFRRILESDAEILVVGEAADGVEAVEAARSERPDVLLMDIRMPRLDGIAATRQISEQADGPRVLVLTTFGLEEYVIDALRAGASGFLLKDVPPEQLLAAVHVVARERVARGSSNAEIARDLVVSDGTVKTHVAHILLKLDLRDRVQAVIYAYESGVVRPGA
jgi:DNA-binding NarL/FixJ family response regulator